MVSDTSVTVTILLDLKPHHFLERSAGHIASRP
jgi:hypothetical protein